MSDQELAAKRLKMGRQKRFQHQWFDDNPSWKIWVKEIPDDPHKFFCLACQTTLVCGLSEIKKHSKSTYHLENMKKLNPNSWTNYSELESSSVEEINPGQSKTQHVPREDFDFNERVKIAEIRLAIFFVEKNLPFSISSELLFLMKDIAKEPDIPQAMSLGRTKLTHIVNDVVCRQETHQISEVLRENKFSIYEDETSVITNDKWLLLMVRYVEPKTLHVRCELLQMIHLNATDCSANKIFQSFENELLKKNISLRLIVGLSCDNASVMIGKTSSFKTKLIEKSPNLVTLPCVCHSSALAAKAACEIIPQDLCRNTLVNWLKVHSENLGNMGILGNFLMEQASENVRPAHNLLSIFQNPSTKAYLFFLEFALDTFNKYNAKFQTRKSIIHELQPSSIKLLLWFLRKFMKPALLKTGVFGHIVRTVNFSDRANHLLLEETDCDFEFFDNKTALFECDRESTVFRVLQVNRRLGKLVDEDEVRNKWKSLYEVDLPTKVDWSKLSFDDMWRQIDAKTRKRNNMSIETLNSI
ncbi:uncharacterized protein LOC115236638 [Formica exsecta]|uniref:uncharacterized protein LOC115236638 n=1 Tax=Formica exsecta TaxID=72781 RepID=UPI001143E018|nr:uncharacterized protein LOC115236638 [Formica exsecta]